MVDFRIILCFLWFIQGDLTWSQSTETQLLGYEESTERPLHTDDAPGRTLIPDPLWYFPSDATLVAFNVRVHGNRLGNNVTLQIWRPAGPARYTLVASSRDSDPSTTGHQRIELPVPQRVKRGDVIGLYSPGYNPVPFQLPARKRDCNETGYMFIEGDAAVGESDVQAEEDDMVQTFQESGECRQYLVTAEYTLYDEGVTMSILGDDVKSRTGEDARTDSVVLPHVTRGFPAPGTLYGWKAFFQQPDQQVVFQVWRPVNTTNHTFMKVYESPAYTQPVPGAVHIRLRPDERSEVRRGDVIALGHPGENPIHYDWSTECERPHLVAQPYNGSEGVEQVFVVGAGSRTCRSYSFQAEYYYAPSEVPIGPNSTSNEHNTSTIITSLPLSSTTPITAPPSTSQTPPTSTTATPPATPSAAAPEPAYFGWEAAGAGRVDGVRSGTVVPDVGRGFPRDGRVIGWVFTASRTDLRIGLQVWRPMPEHPSLTPHARDFSFVGGGNKLITPWHLGENNFTLDQIGEAAFPVRRGDVIALRLEAPNPIPWLASSECTGRYYMDHHGQFTPCARYIMQRTAVCRLYPVKAVVIWDGEMVKKAPECEDPTSNLVPSSPPAPTKKTHIDGCLILNIKSADATYRLTNPDYPTISKHRDLCWVIHLDPSLYTELYIQVTINDLDLRVPKNCDNYAPDFLEIRDGKWSKSHLLRRYCVGWASGPDVIVPCNHYLYLRLRTSTASYGFKGFKLHYQAVEKSGNETTCVRSSPVSTESGARTRNAALIIVVLLVIGVGALIVFAYYRKNKIPQCLGARFFRHQQFHNQEVSFSQQDSPHHRPVTNSELQPQDNGPHLTNETSGYVTFVPGGYPSNGEPVLQLGKIATRPGTNATDPSVMEGITESGVPNGWSAAANNGRTPYTTGGENRNSSSQFGVNRNGADDYQHNNKLFSHRFAGSDNTAQVT